MVCDSLVIGGGPADLAFSSLMANASQKLRFSRYSRFLGFMRKLSSNS